MKSVKPSILHSFGWFGNSLSESTFRTKCLAANRYPGSSCRFPINLHCEINNQQAHLQFLRTFYTANNGLVDKLFEAQRAWVHQLLEIWVIRVVVWKFCNPIINFNMLWKYFFMILSTLSLLITSKCWKELIKSHPILTISYMGI